jgi:hypothetical protein
METVAVVQLAVGGLLAVIWRRDKSWSSLGLLLVVIGFLFAQLTTNSDALRYAAWAVVVVSFVSVALTVPRRTWIDGRGELALASATTLGIWLTYFAQGASTVLFLVSIATTTALAAWLVVRLVRRTFSGSLR